MTLLKQFPQQANTPTATKSFSKPRTASATAFPKRNVQSATRLKERSLRSSPSTHSAIGRLSQPKPASPTELNSASAESAEQPKQERLTTPLIILGLTVNTQKIFPQPAPPTAQSRFIAPSAEQSTKKPQERLKSLATITQTQKPKSINATA